MGYIKRESSPNDKRICLISLTNPGREIIAKIVPENEKMINDYMAKLRLEEKEIFLDHLKKLGENID